MSSSYSLECKSPVKQGNFTNTTNAHCATACLSYKQDNLEKREEFGREAIGRIFPGVEETMRADGGLCDALNGSVVQ